MNKRIMSREIRRISGLSLVATKFKFDPQNVYVDNNFICCELPEFKGYLEESEDTLAKVKEEFAKWLNENGFLKKKGMFTSLAKSANWQVFSIQNTTILCIALKELGLDKQTVKDKLEGNITDVDEYNSQMQEEENKEKEKQETKRKKEEEIKKNTPKDQYRKNNGKAIMKNILNNWK